MLLQLRARSEEDADDELLSVAVVKGGDKAVAGSGTGVLSLYSWGYFNDCSDRFPGEPTDVSSGLCIYLTPLKESLSGHSPLLGSMILGSKFPLL